MLCNRPRVDRQPTRCLIGLSTHSPVADSRRLLIGERIPFGFIFSIATGRALNLRCEGNKQFDTNLQTE